MPNPSQPSPSGAQRVTAAAAVGLFSIALGHVLVVGRAVLMPMVLAILLSVLFGPVVRALSRLRIPTGLSAALIVATLLGSVALGVTSLAGPAQTWLERAPKRLRAVEQKLREIRRPVDRVSQATREVQDIAGRASGAAPRSSQVVLREPSLGDVLLAGTGQLLSGAVVAVTLLFLLLASQDSLFQKLEKMFPDVGGRRIVYRVRHELSGYLLTATAINAALGSVVALAMYAVGMPSPALWGVMAGLLNFIPYLGAIFTGLVITVVSVTSGATAIEMLRAPLLFFAITGTEGYIVTPTIQGNRLRLSPVVVFLSVMLWGSMWGVGGALLAIPIVACFKIVCEEVEALRPLAVLMNPAPRALSETAGGARAVPPANPQT